MNVLPNSEYEYSEEICAGNGIDFFGEWLEISGTYTGQLTSANGCDSLVTLHLEVIPELKIEEDTIVAIGSEVYGHIIWSDTTLVQDLLDENGCPYFLITHVSVFVNSYETKNNFNLKIMPNPNNGQFVLKGELPENGEYNIGIYNIYGQPIGEPYSEIYLNKKFEWKIEKNDLPKGVYYLLLAGEKNKAVISFTVF